MISARLATLHELDTVYGVQDLWWLLEINAVNVHNKLRARKAQESDS